MADAVKKSKTDVSSRAKAKNDKALCKKCGNPIAVVLRVGAGKRKMVRTCCEG